MQGRAKGRAVFWAVDPFAEEPMLPSAQARDFVECVRRAGLELIPVHVLSITERQWELGEVPLLLEVQVRLERRLRRLCPMEDIRPRILVEDSGTVAGAVRALLQLAVREEAGWIAVSAHSRSLMRRWVLGSFVDRLLAESPFPLVFLPHGALSAEAAASRVCLFPTDLTPAAGIAFRKFLEVAAHQRYELVILHALVIPMPVMDMGLGPSGIGPLLPENFAEAQLDWAREEGARLVEEAHHHGVRARFTLDGGTVPSLTGRAVLTAARKAHARLIAMPSRSGPMARYVVGSVAMEVIRSGEALAWIYGPQALSEGVALVA